MYVIIFLLKRVFSSFIPFSFLFFIFHIKIIWFVKENLTNVFQFLFKCIFIKYYIFVLQFQYTSNAMYKLCVNNKLSNVSMNFNHNIFIISKEYYFPDNSFIMFDIHILYTL